MVIGDAAGSAHEQNQLRTVLLHVADKPVHKLLGWCVPTNEDGSSCTAAAGALGDDVEERRLAGSTGAGDEQHLSRLHVARHAMEHRHAFRHDVCSPPGIGEAHILHGS